MKIYLLKSNNHLKIIEILYAFNSVFFIKSCIKLLDSDQLACYLAESKQLYIAHVKPGNSKLEFEEIKLTELKPFDLSLVWSTKDTFLLKSIGNDASSNLYLFSKQGLIKTYENVNSFNLVINEGNLLLIYAKYLSANVSFF